jgi:sortase A
VRQTGFWRNNSAPLPAAARPLSRRARVLWTIGNSLMLVGVVVLLYVGGLFANAEFQRYAARGDTDIPAPQAVVEAPQSAPEPAPFVAPILNSLSGEGRIASPPPVATAFKAEVTRITIPSVAVDAKVVEVGWELERQPDGSEVAVWQVAQYAVGQHHGSANPGDGGNIVLAGHVGGYGKVFRDLYYVQPGEQITLYRGGQQYLYTIDERLVVAEEGVPAEQRAANAAYIAPTDHEVVTLVTCWPASGPDKFKQRVIVRATPFAATAPDGPDHTNWSMR